MNPSILKYQTGEEIKQGDKVLFHGHPGTIELVAGDPNDEESAHYLRQFGGGVMVLDPSVSGRTFIPADQIGDYEDLEFVGRA